MVNIGGKKKSDLTTDVCLVSLCLHFQITPTVHISVLFPLGRHTTQERHMWLCIHCQFHKMYHENLPHLTCPTFSFSNKKVFGLFVHFVRSKQSCTGNVSKYVRLHMHVYVLCEKYNVCIFISILFISLVEIWVQCNQT